jgi:Tol biopolymer transport system component
MAVGIVTYRYAAEEMRVLKVSVLLPEKATFAQDSFPAVSPDGRRLAFAATADGKTSLWVRDLDSLASRPLAGTEGANGPFWSPDSRFLAFFAGRKLKKIDAVGGPALTLCDAANARGGSWSNAGVIVFTPNTAGGLFRVPEAGGSAVPLTGPDQALGENSHRWPWFLPDGRHFLYTARNSDSEKSAVYVADLDSKDRRRVLSANSNAVYAPPGYLLFVRERTLMAQPFDAAKTQTTGDPFPVAEQVDYIDVVIQGQFSSSRNGVLAYTSGALVARSPEQLTWFDRSGKALGTLGEAGGPEWAAISRDGNNVAVSRLDRQTSVRNLWLHDLTRGSASRFTFGLQDVSPIWSPDDSHIAFTSFHDGVPMLYQKATRSAAYEEVLDKTPGSRPLDWSRDGRYIIEGLNDPKTKNDIWVLPLFGNRKPFPYLRGDFNESFARLSPNGHWLAYQSDETKQNEVYVTGFPAPGGKLQISTNGGDRPVWSHDGKELFFIAADGKMMAVETASDGAKLSAGSPKPLFDAHIARPIGPNRNSGNGYDVARDGRFLIPIPVAGEEFASVPMTVVVNWTAGLKR